MILASVFLRGEPPTLLWQPLGEPGSGGALTSLEIDPVDPQHLILGGDMLGAGVSADGGKSWRAATGFQSWEMADATFDSAHPGVVWMGTMSGPYRSEDGGHTWVARRGGMPPVEDGFYSCPILKIWIDPKTPRRCLAFAGSWRRWPSNGGDHLGTVWESVDDGATWTEFSKIKKIRYTLSVAWTPAAPDVFYAVVDEKGFYKSVDGARTWILVKAGAPAGNLNTVVVDPKEANRIWLSAGPMANSEGGFTAGGIYRSVDGGTTWSPCVQGLPQKSDKNYNFTSGFGPLALAPSDPKTLYTSDGSWDAPAIYASHDGGDSWEKIFDNDKHHQFPTAYPAGMGASVLTVDAHDAKVLYAANTESVIRTNDSGATWTDLTSEPAQGMADLWRGNGYSGLCSINIKFNPYQADDCVLSAMDAGRYLHSEDGYKTWRFARKGFDWDWGGGNDVTFAGKGGQIEYGAFGQGDSGNLGKSLDGGKTWVMLGASAASGLPPKNQGTATSVYALPDKPDFVWAVYNGVLYSSQDGGEHFNGNQSVKDAQKIVGDPGNPRHFFVSTKDALYQTTDGLAFSAVPAAPGGIHGFALDPSDAHVVWVTTDDGLSKLHDGKCDMIKAITGAGDVAIDPTHPKRIALATTDNPYHDVSHATGVWLSSDGGATWNQHNDGLACLRGRAIAFNPFHPDELVFGTFGRGYFLAHWPEEK